MPVESSRAAHPRVVRQRVPQQSPPPVAERRQAATWLPSYVRRLVLGDALVIMAATAVAFFARFAAVVPTDAKVWSWVLLVVLPPLWLAALLGFRAYEGRFLGVGGEEQARVLRAAGLVFAVVAITSWAFDLDVARGFVVIAVPLATVLTVLWRARARRQLHARRARGECMQSVVLAGHEAGVVSMLRHMARSQHHGMAVVAICLPRHPAASGEELVRLRAELAGFGVPVVGFLDEVAAVAHREDVDTVAVLPSPELDGHRLRQLGWDLETSRAELLLAPAVAELVGPRVTIRPVNGLPLLHLDRPEHSGARRVAKALVDRSSALAALVLLAPVLCAIAVAVRVDSPGPALFRQERVGKHGRPFTMLKFRSMVTTADSLLIDLRDSSEGNGVLFKMRSDPRITRMGRWLRAYSLDELPQLINVLQGQMSLVGPRPPLAREVALYGPDMHRRMLVKPGLTGLWQVSGRSELSWDESVRLDLRYVENWSFLYDFVILGRTLSAVLGRHGAY